MTWLDESTAAGVLGADLAGEWDATSMQSFCDGVRDYVEDRRRDLCVPAELVTITASDDTIGTIAHNYLAGYEVVLSDLAGGSPLVAGTVYHVVNPTADAVQLAEAAGGPAIDITTDGSATARIYDPAGGGAFRPTGRVVTGAAMLAYRFYSRRTAPLGVLGFSEDGAAGILREDPDIARLLGIGRGRGFVFGAFRRVAVS